MARSSLLDKRIDYRFQDAALRDQALTHRSFGSPHNERLEFLGDAILSCAVAEELEKLGVDLTVHTVGFGLDNQGAVAQLQCLAEKTGGTLRLPRMPASWKRP